MANHIDTIVLEESLDRVKLYVDGLDTAMGEKVDGVAGDLSSEVTRAKAREDAIEAAIDTKIASATEELTEELESTMDSKVGAAKSELEGKIDEKVGLEDIFGEDASSTTLVTNVTASTADRTSPAEGTYGKNLKVVKSSSDLGGDGPTDSETLIDLGEAAGVNALASELKARIKTIEDDMQEQDPALEELINLEGAGLVKHTSGDTNYKVALLEDADVSKAATEAVSFAVTAFGAKDGSVKTNKLSDETAGDYLTTTGTSVDLGTSTDTVVFHATNEASSGKPSVFIQDGAQKKRVPTVDEVNDLIAASIAGSSSYKGQFTFYASDTTLEGAKAKVTGGTANDTALVFSTSDMKIATGSYTASWTWTDATWNNGDWAWVEDLLDLPAAGSEYPSGRVIFDKPTSTTAKFDIHEDKIAKPDNVGLTYTSTGAIGLKMKTDAGKYGDVEVSNALNAANLAYDDSVTIKTKIDSMAYTVATKEEVQAILDRVFGPVSGGDDDEDDDDDNTGKQEP